MRAFSAGARARRTVLMLVAAAGLTACGSGKAKPASPTTAKAVTATPTAITGTATTITSGAPTTVIRKHARVVRARVRHRATRPSTTPAAAPPAAPATPSTKAVSDRTYGLVPQHGLFLLGAPTSSASSTLRVLGKEGKVCWSFASGVAHETAAQVDSGAPGANAIPILKFGKVYQASGCVPAAASVLGGLVKYPAAYYVSVKGGM